MEGQFLVRQIYEDEINYNLIHAAVGVLSKCGVKFPETSVPESLALLGCYAASVGSWLQTSRDKLSVSSLKIKFSTNSSLTTWFLKVEEVAPKRRGN
jgi:hypothetical protein